MGADGWPPICHFEDVFPFEVFWNKHSAHVNSKDARVTAASTCVQTQASDINPAAWRRAVSHYLGMDYFTSLLFC